MLIEQIMKHDTTNCYKALGKDKALKVLDKKLYDLIENESDDLKFELENVVSGYMARVTSIAYLQGMKDFAELYIILKEEVSDILAKYIDKDE